MYLVIIFLLLILVISLFKAVNRVEARYRKMMRGVSNKNLEEMIIEQLDNIEKANVNSEEALKKCDDIREKVKECVQKVAIMRYKAFENIGNKECIDAHPSVNAGERSLSKCKLF